MAHGWKPKALATEGDVFDTLLDLQGRNWMSRGQSACFNELVPFIDRKPHNTLAGEEKIKLERNGIEGFRATARFFASASEGAALIDDFVALMVLQHYVVPTRLLDWSLSPYVALYFAVEDKGDNDGELWSFCRTDYEREGKAQWRYRGQVMFCVFC